MGYIIAINKQAKAWLYADLLEKPGELALYRHTSNGGLGLYHVQLRALANLINSFLETSCNPKFRKSQYHEALFNCHFLESTAPNNLDIPPYFKGDFFPAIKRIHESPLNVANVRVKEIYRFLIEEFTMEADISGVQTLKPLRIEQAIPSIQWEQTWTLARQSMLGPNLTTFLFKLLHQILPTGERVSRILPNQSPTCTRCRDSGPAIDTLQHAMFDCSESQEAQAVL